MFGLNPNKLHEIWRPITSISYLGPPSLSMANNLYFLVRFGQTIEESLGSASYCWFLMLQVIWLAISGLLLGMPYNGQAMIAAIIHVCSRFNPMERV